MNLENEKIMKDAVTDLLNRGLKRGEASKALQEAVEAFFTHGNPAYRDADQLKIAHDKFRAASK
jgi:hypothetical protein